MERLKELSKRYGPLIKVLEKRKEGPLIRILKDSHVLEKLFEDLKPESLDADDFYNKFIPEIADSKEEIIIYSPFISRDRFNTIISQIAKVAKSGVSVTVHTLNSDSWWVKKKKFHQKAIEELKKNNIDVTVRKLMHEKAAIIDGKISYMESVNILSCRGGSSDYMLRFENPDLTKGFMIFLETLAERSEEEEKII